MSLVISRSDVRRRPVFRSNLALLLVGLVLAGLGLLGAGVPAGAVEQTRCRCQFQTVASQARAADVIFSGAVTSVTRDPVANNPEVFNDTYTATVEAIYKGDLTTTETTFRTDRVFGQCSGVFASGTNVVVFAQDGEPMKVRGCAGTDAASDNLTRRIESIFGAGTSPIPPEPFDVTYSAPTDQPGAPGSMTRAAAPGLALVLVSLAGLVVVRRLARPRP